MKNIKKKICKVLVLILTFVAAVVVSSELTNKTNRDLTMNMKEASLPVVFFLQDDTRICELFGNTQPMNAIEMRNDILPVSMERDMTVGIQSYGNRIRAFQYEIYTIDGQRLLANGEETYLDQEQMLDQEQALKQEQSWNQNPNPNSNQNPNQDPNQSQNQDSNQSQNQDWNQNPDQNPDSDKLTIPLKLQNILTADTEYQMRITLKTESRELYYYTRILMDQNCHTKECLEFAKEFHNRTFDKKAGSYFVNYIETRKKDRDSLQYVDLSSSIKMIQWDELTAIPDSDLQISFKEINDYYTSIQIRYLLRAEPDRDEIYNVEEYYRLRYTKDRMYVLDFERTMNRIFRSENNFETEQGLKLGIRDGDVEYAVNEAQDKVCFVQEGDLWSYDLSQNQLVQVFSFRGPEKIELRENYSAHRIKIIRVDESGGIDFIVSGYMNRGTREGMTGIAVYYYDGSAHTVEEKVFLAFDVSDRILQAETGTLMYVNEKEQLYLLSQGKLYCVDLKTRKVERIIEGLTEGWYAASESNRFFAWMNSEPYQGNTILVRDLESGSSMEIKGENTQRLKPLGFMREDFIYGVANQGDIRNGSTGWDAFPINMLRIVRTEDLSMTVLKEYRPQQGYVGDIEITESAIFVNLMQEMEGVFVQSGTDSIMNKEVIKNLPTAVSTFRSAPKGIQLQLQLAKKRADTDLRRITSRHVMVEKDTTVSLGRVPDREQLYVYAKGKAVMVTESLPNAVSEANERKGVVLNEKGQCLWNRTTKISQKAFSRIQPFEGDRNSNTIVQCVSSMLVWEKRGICVKDLVERGYTPKEILEMQLKDAVVVDLTGCTVEEIIYYISCQTPVMVQTGTESAVLLIGYTKDSISIYDPAKEETEEMNRSEADLFFRKIQNRFLSYKIVSKPL